MTTVINNPGESSDSGAGLIISVVVVLVLIVLFFVYALPAIRNKNTNPGTTIKVELPTSNNSAATPQ